MDRRLIHVGTSILMVLLFGVIGTGCVSSPVTATAAKAIEAIDTRDGTGLICYEPYGGPIKKEGRYDTKYLLISPFWHDTPAEVAEAVGEPAAAYSDCIWSNDGIMGWCDLWLVEPSEVLGDPHMDGIGHEVLHGLWGPNWHD